MICHVLEVRVMPMDQEVPSTSKPRALQLDQSASTSQGFSEKRVDLIDLNSPSYFRTQPWKQDFSEMCEAAEVPALSLPSQNATKGIYLSWIIVLFRKTVELEK